MVVGSTRLRLSATHTSFIATCRFQKIYSTLLTTAQPWRRKTDQSAISTNSCRMSSILAMIRMMDNTLPLRPKMFSPTSMTLHLSRYRRTLTWLPNTQTDPLHVRSRNRQYLVIIHLITSMTIRTPKQRRVLLKHRKRSHSYRMRALNLISKSRKIPDMVIV